MFKQKYFAALVLLAVPAAVQAPASHLARAARQNVDDARAGDADEDAVPLAWLAGHWVGEGFGGVVEEWWSPARAGAMMGVFRLVVDDRTVLYETVTIDAVGPEKSWAEGPWGMRLRHFHSDLRAWEEKDEPLVWESTVLEDSRAGFGPVIYERMGEDELRVSVEVGKENETTVERLVMHRQR